MNRAGNMDTAICSFTQHNALSNQFSAMQPLQNFFKHAVSAACLAASFCSLPASAVAQGAANFQSPAGAAPSELVKKVAGSWYGEYARAGAPTQRYLMTRREDGFYELWARLYDPSGRAAQETRELSRWRTSGADQVEFQPVARNGQPIDVSARQPMQFTLLSSSADTLVFRLHGTSEQMQVFRVSASHRLPD